MEQNIPTFISTKENIIIKACKSLCRECPQCGLTTIKGMPGGRDATCINCGYKDPCCYD